jgi:hypothetical protein
MLVRLATSRIGWPDVTEFEFIEIVKFQAPELSSNTSDMRRGLLPQYKKDVAAMAVHVWILLVDVCESTDVSVVVMVVVSSAVLVVVRLLLNVAKSVAETRTAAMTIAAATAK